MAAQELGLLVADMDIEAAIAAYQRMFNTQRGFLPTSLKQQDILGQDTLYGATLTYAAFGRKVLTDEQVLAHYRTSEKVKSPHGLRVISQADGSLLPGHNGVYCYGGSWFFCDAGNYLLLAGVHGLPAGEVDQRLIERIEKELVRMPAFNEDIDTVTGQPHGNTPYADYSGFLWLRSESAAASVKQARILSAKRSMRGWVRFAIKMGCDWQSVPRWAKLGRRTNRALSSPGSDTPNCAPTCRAGGTPMCARSVPLSCSLMAPAAG